MIAIVDYGVEKINPLADILSKLTTNFKITQSEFEILRAEKIILPNTSSISIALKQLHLLNLFTMLRVCKKPMLGISAGMHLMSSHTKEGNYSCLGMFPGTVEKLPDKKETSSANKLREVILLKRSRLLKDFEGDEKFYFESYYYLPVDKFTSAVTGHEPIYSAVVEDNNYFGVQFLPEKSGEAGVQILRNFLNFDENF